jgi:hypothetical protein
MSLYEDGNQANTPLYFENLRKTLETKGEMFNDREM